MMKRPVYADSSFLMSHFLNDVHTDEARCLIHEIARPLQVSPLCELEYRTSIWRKVGLEGFKRGHAERAIMAFDEQFRLGRFVMTEVNEKVVWERARNLGDLYAAELKVRSLDIWHVAFAVELGLKFFWTFDDRQKLLASRVGMQVNCSG